MQRDRQTLVKDDGWVDLWILNCADPNFNACLGGAHRLLGGDELRRAQHFYFENDQRRHLLTRMLQRKGLSRYVDVAPQDFLFATDACGKPYIDMPQQAVGKLSFNLSHTQNWIVLAVTSDCEIGVDVENVAREIDVAGIAYRYFTRQECDDIFSQPPHSRALRCFEFWTLKEAYVKARGEGLSMPLNRFSFEFHSDRTLSLHVAPAWHAQEHDWWCWQGCLGADGLLAVCMQRLVPKQPKLRIFQLDGSFSTTRVLNIPFLRQTRALGAVNTTEVHMQSARS